jgi:hypothetical protein
MEKNIFVAAANEFQRKKKLSKVDDKKAPFPVSPTLSKAQNSEIEQMLKKMQDMRKDIEEKVATLYAKGRECNVDIDKRFGSQLYLSNLEFQLLKEKEKELTQKISEALPADSCIKPSPKSKEKLARERKGKMRGARKNWLRMP